MRQVAVGGHEIGARGYSHENALAMDADPEREVLLRSIELVEKISGRRPRGCVTPWWEMSNKTGVPADGERLLV